MKKQEFKFVFPMSGETIVKMTDYLTIKEQVIDYLKKQNEIRGDICINPLKLTIMKKYPVYNENGEDNGLIISVYQQGNQWIACVTNDKIDYWQELPLGCRTVTKNDVREWAFAYAEGERFEFRM